MARKRPGKLTRQQEALLETTRDFVTGGLAPESDLKKLTVRLLGKDGLPQAPSLSGEEIADLREKQNVSQAILAAYLGVTVGYLSRLERGKVAPSRPVARLLDIIRRKGLEAVS